MAETTPYTKQTWTDGVSSASAARLTVIEEGVRAAHEQPAARVTHNATQSIVSGTETSLAFNTERFDQAFGSTSTQHDTAVNNTRLTARYAGVYLVGANVEWSASPSTCAFRLRLNGATYIAHSGTVGVDNRQQQLTTIYALAVNDYVEVRVTQSSGGAINVNATANFSPEFWFARIG